jgi:hypothetical protein
MKPNQLDPFQTPFMRSPNALRLAQHKANNTLESSYFCKRLYTEPKNTAKRDDDKKRVAGARLGKAAREFFLFGYFSGSRYAFFCRRILLKCSTCQV